MAELGRPIDLSSFTTAIADAQVKRAGGFQRNMFIGKRLSFASDMEKQERMLQLQKAQVQAQQVLLQQERQKQQQRQRPSQDPTPSVDNRDINDLDFYINGVLQEPGSLSRMYEGTEDEPPALRPVTDERFGLLAFPEGPAGNPDIGQVSHVGGLALERYRESLKSQGSDRTRLEQERMARRSGSGIRGGWTEWITVTPVLTGIGGDPTMGSTTLTGKYTVNDRLCLFSFKLEVTTGGSWDPGSGAWRVSLPVDMATGIVVYGSGVVFENTAGVFHVTSNVIQNGDRTLGSWLNGLADQVGATAPAAWITDSVWEGSIMYPVYDQ